MKKYLYLIILIVVPILTFTQNLPDYNIKTISSIDDVTLIGINGVQWDKITIERSKIMAKTYITDKGPLSDENGIEENAYSFIFTIKLIEESPNMHGGFNRMYLIESLKGSTWKELKLNVHLNKNEPSFTITTYGTTN